MHPVFLWASRNENHPGVWTKVLSRARHWMKFWRADSSWRPPLSPPSSLFRLASLPLHLTRTLKLCSLTLGVLHSTGCFSHSAAPATYLFTSWYIYIFFPRKICENCWCFVDEVKICLVEGCASPVFLYNLRDSASQSWNYIHRDQARASVCVLCFLFISYVIVNVFFAFVFRRETEVLSLEAAFSWIKRSVVRSALPACWNLIVWIRSCFQVAMW